MTRSITRPVIRPMITFAITTRKIVRKPTADEIKIGSISSEVDKKTANNVPNDITPPEKRLAAAAENPHCGTIPKRPPITGPALPTFLNASADLSSVFRSRNSMNR